MHTRRLTKTSTAETSLEVSSPLPLPSSCSCSSSLSSIERPLQRHGGRLDLNETYCGSCYGSEVVLFSVSIREGFIQKFKEEEGEGCNIHGFLEVSKVAGSFHFAPGKSFRQPHAYLHDLLVFQRENYNVVPTIYTYIKGRQSHSNQFSVTEHFQSSESHPQVLPGVLFFYELSPITVIFKEEHVSFLHS